jgi:hypothetical protein
VEFEHPNPPRLGAGQTQSDGASTLLGRASVADANKGRPRVDSDALHKQLERLTSKRQRILDSYFEGVINISERDLRLAAIERERRTVTGLLANHNDGALSFSAGTLAELFAPFAEFDLLTRSHKRQLLNTITPQIVAANYQIGGIYLSGLMRSHTATGFLKNDSRIWLPLGLVT